MVLLLMDFDSEYENEMQVNTSGELSGESCIRGLVSHYHRVIIGRFPEQIVASRQCSSDRSAVGFF